MRAVVALEGGILELNYLWLPTVIGMNAGLKQQMEKDLQEKVRGKLLDDKGLDEAHDLVVSYLVEKFPGISGLADYLDGLKYLEP